MQDDFIELDLDMDFDNEVDPESLSEDWMYTEHMIYMPVCPSRLCSFLRFVDARCAKHSFFVTDHRQSAERSVSLPGSTPEALWREEENRRLSMRREVFPDLAACVSGRLP
jgi:protein O-GlcNAc transferase